MLLFGIKSKPCCTTFSTDMNIYFDTVNEIILAYEECKKSFDEVLGIITNTPNTADVCSE